MRLLGQLGRETDAPFNFNRQNHPPECQTTLQAHEISEWKEYDALHYPTVLHLPIALPYPTLLLAPPPL